MPRTRLAVVVTGVTLGLAACTSNGSATPGASGSAGASGGPSTGASAGASAGAANPSAAPGVANQCVVGKWRSTAVTMTFTAGTARGQASGGDGVLLTVSPDGQVVADFSGAKPIIFTTNAAGTEIKGQFGYGGTLKGAVQVPASATSTGVWRPVGTSDFSAVTVTVEMMSPVQGKIVDHAKLGDYASSASDQSAGSVDVQPILREGTYECGGDTLKLGPAPGTNGGVTWTMKRA